MNRRAFLPSLLALPVATAVTFDTPANRALQAVVPVCPKCGRHVLFMRPSEYVGDLVPVLCGCGWRGHSPVAQ